MTDTPSWIVRIPTPLWLVGLVIVALGVDWLLDPGPVAKYWPAGTVLIAAGFAFSSWARLTFKKQRAEIIPSSDVHPTLVAAGPFRITRNPMYLGIFVIGIGAALVAGTWPMWLVPVLLFALDNFVIIPFEERSMERAFGDAFRAYKTRVRRWL